MASNHGFAHYDLESKEVRDQFSLDSEGFISRILESGKNAVVTWGFFPDEQQMRLVTRFRQRGFQIVWFDGNRPSALREFIARGRPEQIYFYAQMYRIEESRVIEKIAPLVIDPFDANGSFRDVSALLHDIDEKSARP